MLHTRIPRAGDAPSIVKTCHSKKVPGTENVWPADPQRNDAYIQIRARVDLRIRKRAAWHEEDERSAKWGWRRSVNFEWRCRNERNPAELRNGVTHGYVVGIDFPRAADQVVISGAVFRKELQSSNTEDRINAGREITRARRRFHLRGSIPLYILKLNLLYTQLYIRELGGFRNYRGCGGVEGI